MDVFLYTFIQAETTSKVLETVYLINQLTAL